MPRIIGITGKARSGKDEAGKVLLAHGFYRLGMADIIAVMYGASVGKAPYELDTSDPATRKGMQDLGLSLRKKVWDGYWLRRLDTVMGWLNAAVNPAGCYIPNIRFANELEWVYKQGGKMLGVMGRGGLEGKAGQHPSEQEVDGLVKRCDAVVVNDGTLAAHRQRVELAVAPWLRDWGLA